MNNIVSKKSKPKKRKRLKTIKASKRYRSSTYRLTYDELYNLTNTELNWYINNGHPEEKDMARRIRNKKKMDNLVTYGY